MKWGRMSHVPWSVHHSGHPTSILVRSIWTINEFCCFNIYWDRGVLCTKNYLFTSTKHILKVRQFWTMQLSLQDKLYNLSECSSWPHWNSLMDLWLEVIVFMRERGLSFYPTGTRGCCCSTIDEDQMFAVAHWSSSWKEAWFLQKWGKREQIPLYSYFDANAVSGFCRPVFKPLSFGLNYSEFYCWFLVHTLL